MTRRLATFGAVILASVTALGALAISHRQQLRVELSDAPYVFDRSLTVDLLLGRDLRRMDCIRTAPPDTMIRAVMRRIDDEVFDWKYRDRR